MLKQVLVAKDKKLINHVPLLFFLFYNCFNRVDCIPGSAMVNGSCVMCSDGYWSPGFDGSCTSCGENKTTQGEGADAMDDCG